MSTSANLARRIESGFQRRLQALTVYEVQPGDTLTRIIRNYFGIVERDQRYQMALAHVLYFNSAVTDPNLIYAGQILRLPPIDDSLDPRPYCDVNDPVFAADDYGPTMKRILAHGPIAKLQAHWPKTQAERDLFWTLAWLHENYDYLSIGAGSGMSTWGNLVSDANRATLAEVKALYDNYKAGRLTKGAYDYRRQQVLKEFAQRMGPFEKFLFKGRSTREAIRISRTKALPATVKIDSHLHRLSRMANYAKYGGILLTAAGVGMGCYNIAQTQDRQQKNEIFVETVGSAIVGSAASVALGVFLVGTPVGWVTALALGTGATLAAYASGKGFRSIYNQYGQSVDLLNMTQVDEICRS